MIVYKEEVDCPNGCGQYWILRYEDHLGREHRVNSLHQVRKYFDNHIKAHGYYKKVHYDHGIKNDFVIQRRVTRLEDVMG